ncbi:MAG: hypothetical protein HGA44_13300 [Cellulomonadaceae bacterium]|nr:hypothetical protein [Cellulomonadaceae bacterium]
MASTRRKSAAIALAVLGIAGLSLASAAQLNVTSNTLQAGAVTVNGCDADGVNVTYTYGWSAGQYTATAAVVNGISASCGTGTVGVTVSDGAAVVTTAAPVAIPAAGGAVTVTLPTAISAAALSNVAVVISK